MKKIRLLMASAALCAVVGGASASQFPLFPDTAPDNVDGGAKKPGSKSQLTAVGKQLKDVIIDNRSSILEFGSDIKGHIKALDSANDEGVIAIFFKVASSVSSKIDELKIDYDNVYDDADALSILDETDASDYNSFIGGDNLWQFSNTYTGDGLEMLRILNTLNTTVGGVIKKAEFLNKAYDNNQLALMCSQQLFNIIEKKATIQINIQNLEDRLEDEN